MKSLSLQSPPQFSPGINRVVNLEIIGVTVSDKLTVSQHVAYRTSGKLSADSRIQSLHAVSYWEVAAWMDDSMKLVILLHAI